jgi:hypothetical protein
VHRRLCSRLVQPPHGFRPRPHREEILGSRHIFAGREVFSPQAERTDVALSCNKRKNIRT